MRGALVAIAILAACKDQRRDAPAPQPPEVTAVAAATASPSWPALAGYPLVEAVRTFGVPAKHTVPRQSVAGPILDGELAIVASSQFGFLAVDWRTERVVWSKPSGPRVAPPLGWGSRFALIGDCLAPPPVPDGERLLGCLRVVTRSGADVTYIAIRGSATALGDFDAEVGARSLVAHDDALRWVRGDQAVTIDTATGIARLAQPPPPPADDTTTLLGHARSVRAQMAGEQPQLVLEVEGASSAARPLPGIQVYGHATSSAGEVALAIRLDSSLQRDYVAAFDASLQLAWVHPLPEIPRADRIGVAIADDAVVVFHDGDTFTILPAVSGRAKPSDSSTP